MSRILLPTSGYSIAPATEVQSQVVGLVEFLEVDLPTGNLYLTNGTQSYTWGSHTYTPVSNTGIPFKAMQNYAESTDGVPRPMSLQISGVDQTLVNTMATDNLTWISIVWSLGLLDKNNNLLNGTPMFQAPLYLGDATISLGTNTGSININCENLLADMQNRQAGMLQTIGDQEQRFSGDTFFKFCASLDYAYQYWGMNGPSTMGVGYGGANIGQGGDGFEGGTTTKKQF